ncbi:MAG: tetratricopeptide repeat protein, partial [Candidatus Auribacterota bacterium]|nr:tetratricopeptide repeat protein [Candidatus Auribacterota bacterium]
HDSSGTYHIPPSLTEKSKNQNEINWVVETLKEIKQYPRITLRNFFNKILLFWGGYEIPNNVDFYLHTEYSSILRSGILSFRIIVALSFVGFIVTIKNLRKTWIVYSALLATFLPCIIFFVLGRLRFPALPFLMILASAGTVWCFMRLFQKNPFPLIIVFIYLICLKNFIWFPGEYTASSNSINNLGVAERSKKEYHKAGLLFIRAILADPYKIKPHINLALTYIAQGIYNEALKECFFVLSLNPEHKNANSLAGEILFHKRDFSESLAYFSKVAKLYPDDWAALYFCGLCNYNIGKEKAALEYLEKAFEQATGNSKKITQDAIKLIKKTNEK